MKSLLKRMGSACSTSIIKPKRSVKIFPKNNEMNEKRVFLGGACGSTTWRENFMRVLDENGIAYYNPQVLEGRWHEGLIHVERIEKEEKCNVLLFVIGKETRAIASMVDASYYVGLDNNRDNNRVLLVVEDCDRENKSQDEWNDINQGRKYLRDMAINRRVPCFVDLKDALACIIAS